MILGDHGSWLFAYLMTAMSQPIAPSASSLLAGLRAQKIEPAREKIPSMMTNDFDFLYIPAILAVTDRVEDVSPLPEYPLDDLYPLMSPITLANSHTAGQAMVRVWPFAIESQRDDAACERWNSRLSEMFSRNDQWKAHWVPQFMWMGMWLEMGRP